MDNENVKGRVIVIVVSNEIIKPPNVMMVMMIMMMKVALRYKKKRDTDVEDESSYMTKFDNVAVFFHHAIASPTSLSLAYQKFLPVIKSE